MTPMRRLPSTPALGRRTPSVLLALALSLGAASCVDTPHYSPTRTYYVSPEGDDRHDGTSETQAWRTLARAERVALEPGDRLLLRGGARFHGTVTIKANEAGSTRSPVLISSYGDGRATVVASTGPGISVHNTAGVKISDLTVTGGSGTRADEGGINLYNDRPGGGKLGPVELSGIEVSGFAVGVAIGGKDEKSGFRDVSVRQARLHDNKDAGLLAYGPDFDPERPAYTHRNIDIEDVEAFRNPGDPTAAHRHTGDGIILGSVRDATVRESSAHDNGARSSAEAPSGPVGIWAYDATAIRIERNVSYRNHTGSDVDGAGFGLDSNVSSSTLQYNLTFGNDGPGYYAYSRTANGAHRDNTIRYNISASDGRKLSHNGGIAVHGKDIRDLKIYQNTVVMPDSSHGAAPALRLRQGEQGVVLRNNVLVNESGPVLTAESGLGPADVTLQGNNYRTTDGAWSVDWGSRTYPELSAWRAATDQERVGQRATGLTIDPCFTGGELPAIRSAHDARAVVPDCTGQDGLDLRALFGTDPGDVDYFGNEVPVPPPVGAAVPQDPDSGT
ncbi:right-handed parallel beta-helix repeat-containing protein [Streptomyces sp. NPDC006516]|uniref:right-handed parallel beta-helix repeat-containing protein n=1 Tax=Streptomyces sp. NPDC006516 TaxID=3154309 RepID=UPI0033B9987B